MATDCGRGGGPREGRCTILAMTPELFVARDRARRLGYRLEKVLQERRLAWRGAEIGMSTVSDDADQALADIAQDARRSVEQVLAGEIRDRERGFMEIPFAVALTAVAQRVEDAAALEAGRRLRQVPEARGRKGVVDALAAALARLEAFQAAYDAKTPLPEARTLDLAHLLTHLAPPGERPYDRPPPPLVTDAHGLEDLLLAARAALGDDDVPLAGDAPRRGSPPHAGPGLRPGAKRLRSRRRWTARHVCWRFAIRWRSRRSPPGTAATVRAGCGSGWVTPRGATWRPRSPRSRAGRCV